MQTMPVTRGSVSGGLSDVWWVLVCLGFRGLRCVTFSTTEAEYVALAGVVKDALLHEL